MAPANRLTGRKAQRGSYAASSGSAGDSMAKEGARSSGSIAIAEPPVTLETKVHKRAKCTIFANMDNVYIIIDRYLVISRCMGINFVILSTVAYKCCMQIAILQTTNLVHAHPSTGGI